MADTPPVARFVRILASALLREGEPSALAREAREALEGVFAAQKSLVLDVQFTGFSAKGQPVAGVDPVLLRAAGTLIMLRVTRVGFTADVTADDLETFLRAATRGAGDLGADGLLGAIREAQPRGIYVSTNAGETYRPPAPVRPAAAPTESEDAAPATPPTDPSASVSGDAEPSPRDSAQAVTEDAKAPASPSASADAQPDAGDSGDAVEAPGQPSRGASPFDAEEATDFSDFEFEEAFAAYPPPPAAQEPAGAASTVEPVAAPLAAAGDAGHGAMYQFFRASSGIVDPEANELPGMLRAAEALDRFDAVAQSCGRTAQRLIAGDRLDEAVVLLDALVAETQRPDRGRVFREAAVQGLRQVTTEPNMQRLADLIQREGADRAAIVRVFLFAGGEALAHLERVLFRTGDAGLRRLLFRTLAKSEGAAGRIITRALGDPAAGRARAMLEIAADPDMEPELALRWIGEAAAHPDAAVRTDAARHAATVGGRGGLRVLVDLLGDAAPAVKRAAVQGLATTGDAAAVPFLGRVLNDSADEDVQLAAVAALGKLGSAEAVPALAGVVNKRQLLGGKRLSRLKMAALAALGHIPAPAAREVLSATASGRDADLAAEARQILQLLD
ncbi:MAG TPA: HEAT repeat domain-containing protein [Longimicrobiaceae bacterium]|nr:HEAT repeat domain-containing protein [Longimicrobiaceae bacterium]